VKYIFAIAVLFITLVLAAWATDATMPTGLRTHYTALTTIPSSAADLYTHDVWLKDIILIPQSTTNPTCVIQDKAATPNIVYPTVALTANHKYEDSFTQPVLMSGGFTWSCSDTTVKAQVTVLY